MKVYFTTSIKDADKNDNINTILKTIKELGHSVEQYNDKKRSEAAKTDADSVNAYKYFTSAIKKCDFVVAEISEQSASVGYEIAFALEEKKPVLVLYEETKARSLSALFRGNKSRHLKVRKYKGDREIESAVKFFVNDVNEIIDTKFILIIPPSIDQYLEWNVKERGIPKAEVTREAIEKAMNEDERYQAYLKSQEISE